METFYAICGSMIFIFLAIYFSWKAIKIEEREWGKYGGYVEVGYLILCIAIIVIPIIFCFKVNNYYEGYSKSYLGSKDSKIFSIKYSSEISGAFFLGIGSINERQYYYVYKQVEYGGIVFEKYRVESVTLYETDGNPQVTEYGYYDDIYLHGKLFKSRYTFRPCECKVSLYIPKGTITEKINPFDL